MLLFLVPLFCNAQIIYGPTYNRNNGTSSYSQPQQTSQVTSTTAYALDGYGNVIKMRIKVGVVSNGYSESLKVTEYYKSSTYGGQWFKMGTPATVFKCSSVSAYGNALESNFMYKVNIAGAGTGYWYFDL